MNYFTRLFQKHAQAKSRIDPERDWIGLMIGTVLALSCVVVWNVWAFDTVANGGVLGELATTTPVFSQASLDSIHAIFTSRAEEERAYVSGGYHFADPSL